jgi:sigma-B regulation protein RsbU (phosphoserine phosphatase)
VEVTLRTTEEKLRVARRVQQGLLPKSSPEVKGFDIAGRSYPAEVVGGDYFDFIPMLNGQMGIVVADVSGHEIGASILMSQTRAYLRALSLSHDDIVSMVSQVNRFLSRDVQDRWFVTLFYVALDSKNATFQYAAAGHECYLFNSEGNVQTLESTSPPLGVVDDRDVPCGPEMCMPPGSILLLMTDGLIETSNPSGQHLGLERTFAVIKANSHRTANEIVDALYAEAERFRGTIRREDDITVVVAKRNRQ